jgi:molybdopterin converting factor small subunit
MRVEVQLFGAFREAEPSARIAVDCAGATVAALREAVALHAGMHWPPATRALLARSAFASPSQVLRDADALPEGVPMALLPPVSGG